MLVLGMQVGDVTHIEIPPSNETRFMRVMLVRPSHIGIEAEKSIRIIRERARVTREQEASK